MDPVNDANISVDTNLPAEFDQSIGDNEWASLVETLKEERTKILSIIK